MGSQEELYILLLYILLNAPRHAMDPLGLGLATQRPTIRLILVIGAWSAWTLEHMDPAGILAARYTVIHCHGSDGLMKPRGLRRRPRTEEPAVHMCMGRGHAREFVSS